jgi:hypothetical protein
MIIFDKFGDGQAERNRTVPVFPNNPMRIITLRAPFGMTNEGKMETSSQMGEGLSGSALPARSASLTRDRIAASVCGPRVEHREPRTPLSNRELGLLGRPLSHCKQRNATVSNRELSTVCNAPKIVDLVSSSISESPFRSPISDRNFRQLTTFLPGSDRKVELTEKKRLNPVYPALEMHINAVQVHTEFRTESPAQREKECRSRDAAEQGKLPLHIRNAKELL